MSVTVMIINRIRDIVSNLGWKSDNSYNIGENCLSALERLEEELTNEDVSTRNIRLCLQICGTVQQDLIPILICEKDPNILAVVTRILAGLTLPVECLIPEEESNLNCRCHNARNQLVTFSNAMKIAFLDSSATLSLVTILREMMIKSVKHSVPLSQVDCDHLKNCLFLIRNILHIPEDIKSSKPNYSAVCNDPQSVQNKLIWNLFVQGLDGALVLMLNSKYRLHWTVPLALIIALLYRNQNIGKIYQALELISSPSESSEDEESDSSKNSMCSEISKNVNSCSDSGYFNASDNSACTYIKEKEKDLENLNNSTLQSESLPITLVNKKLEKFQINEVLDNNLHEIHRSGELKNVCVFYKDEIDSESSGCYSPHHKKIKSNYSDDKCEKSFCKDDSAVSMESSSPESMSKFSDDDDFQAKKISNHLKVVQKLRSLQVHMKTLESDSSNEDSKVKKVKHRMHPPTGRRGKSPRRNGCSPSICMDTAYAIGCSKGRIRYPLWEKRNSVSILVDVDSGTPTNDEIGNLLKEFTLSFLHGRFSDLALDIKNLLFQGQPFIIDKSVLFWILSYFLHLAKIVNIKLDHICGIITFEMVSYLVYECVSSCEKLEMQLQENEKLYKYICVHLNLIIAALKEVISTVDLYSKKCVGQKDKLSFSLLCGKLADLQDLRNLPLLLFRNCPKIHSKQFLEDTITLNHHLLSVVMKGTDMCWKPTKINLQSHLKMFSNSNIINSFAGILQNFKTNSQFLNECIFTMMHHLAGDINSAELLFEPSILKTFSEILEEDMELEQYQEDLIMYIMNKFAVEVEKRALKMKKSEELGNSSLCDDLSSESSMCSNNLDCEDENDDLFWWYLQFEQDADPISQISEHISIEKKDILTKLHLKGIISLETCNELEEKMDKNLITHPDKELSKLSDFNVEITQIMRALVQAGDRQYLIWLQEVLLELCYIKLNHNHLVSEPVSFYSLKMTQSVPLVPYTEEQKAALNNELFIQLLEKLGFQLGFGTYQIYPRIPAFWSVDIIFALAARLGPIKKDTLKFCYEDLHQNLPNYDLSTYNKHENSVLPPLSSCGTLSSWLSAVQQSKEDSKTS